MQITIQREKQNAVCTQGTMTVGDKTLATLERPWIASINGPGGQAGISCVPAGQYALLLHDSELHPKTFALSNPDLGVIHFPNAAYPYARTAVLIHVANYVQELQGCVGVGLEAGDCTIASSRAAMQLFQSLVPWIPGNSLIIKDPI